MSMYSGSRVLQTMLLSWLLLCGQEAIGAQFKPIENHPSYSHDRFITKPGDIVREIGAYVTSFDSDDDDNGDGTPDLWGVPHYVAYEMKRFEGHLGKGPSRPAQWITDDDLYKSGIAPKDATYQYSPAFRNSHPNWYVRGHLCMKQHAWRLGENADWNTHTVLNAVPQRSDFNTGIWQDLENRTAAWADKYGAVWIIVGPVFNNLTPTKFLGEAAKNEMLIAIPVALFKIVVKDRDGSSDLDVLAFIYPQEGKGYSRGPHNHKKYLRSVDEIEELTGLDFFSALSEKEQQEIESEAATELWK